MKLLVRRGHVSSSFHAAKLMQIRPIWRFFQRSLPVVAATAGDNLQIWRVFGVVDVRLDALEGLLVDHRAKEGLLLRRIANPDVLVDIQHQCSDLWSRKCYQKQL